MPYAATLVKHKHVHDADNVNFEGAGVFSGDIDDSNEPSSGPSTPPELTQITTKFKAPQAPSAVSQPRGKKASSLENFRPIVTPVPKAVKKEPDAAAVEEKTFFCCDRCPYSHGRRDAVQSHMKRHDRGRNMRDGKKCPHCDYVCLQPSYLREHIRLHFDPVNQRKASAFRKYSEIEVWATRKKQNGEEEKTLLFKDNGCDVDIQKRFAPVVDDEDLFELLKSVKTEADGLLITTVSRIEPKHLVDADEENADDPENSAAGDEHMSDGGDVDEQTADESKQDESMAEADEEDGSALDDEQCEEEDDEEIDEQAVEQCELMLEEQEICEIDAEPVDQEFAEVEAGEPIDYECLENVIDITTAADIFN